MKTVLWSLISVALLLWTGGAWLVASLGAWLQEATANGASVDWPSMASGLRFPAWVTLWFDPALVHASINAAVGVVQSVWTAIPWISTAVGWVATLTWLVWGVGVAALLLAGAAGHWGIVRFTRVGASGAQV